MSVFNDLKHSGITHYPHSHITEEGYASSSPSRYLEEDVDGRGQKRHNEVAAFSSARQTGRVESTKSVQAVSALPAESRSQDGGSMDADGEEGGYEKFDDMSSTKVGIILLR